MPRKYARKSNRNGWDEERLAIAVQKVKEDGMAVRAAGRKYGIPESTVRKALKSGNTVRGALGRRPTFDPDAEKRISDHVLEMARLYYGLTPYKLRKLAYQYAEANNISHTFNTEKRVAGKDWMYLFLKRNPQIKLRQPEGTSLNRISAFNEEEVARFYSNLETVMKKFEFEAARIFNMDETGITTVPKKSPKVYGEKGAKRIGSAISAERGRTVTAVFCMSASGTYIPPMLIYPRVRMTPLLQKNGPPGSVYRCSKNGWTNEVLFVAWLKHFQRFVKASADDPVLLVLDNHGSHISVEATEFCRSNSIHVVSLPPHTSHRLQPPDLTFFSSLKDKLYRLCDSQMNKSGHEKITEYDLAELLAKAYDKVATMDKAKSGFASAGIFPLDPDKFTSEDFAPALGNAPPIPIVCDENETPLVILPALSSTIMTQLDSSTAHLPASSSTTTTQLDSSAAHLPPSSSTTTAQLDSSTTQSHDDATATNSLPTKATKPRKTNKLHSEILTSTPQLEKAKIAKKKREEREKKKDMARAKRKLNLAAKNEKTPRKKRGKKKVQLSESESSEIDDMVVPLQDDSDDNDEESDIEETCNICGEFGKSEMWFCCKICKSWAHKKCTNAESASTYICDFCQPQQRKSYRK